MDRLSLTGFGAKTGVPNQVLKHVKLNTYVNSAGINPIGINEYKG
jgi:hypothetical protein